MSTLKNCTLSGNSVSPPSRGGTKPGSGGGGGARTSTLNNCTLTGNFAPDSGGGAYNCRLNNCVLTANSADYGGGADRSSLNNCIVYYNNAPTNSNCSAGTLNSCCTTPLPSNGVANITNEPGFVNLAVGNLRLQSNSPCINPGRNAYAPAGPDLDGNMRVVGDTVDIGAYEFQSPASVISYAWLQQYGLPTDGSADYAHADEDGLNNCQEWRCGTDPTNALSVLRLLIPGTNESGLTVTWESVSSRSYWLERATNLGTPPFLTIQSNIAGQAGTTTYLDTNVVGDGPFFYRVGVEE